MPVRLAQSATYTGRDRWDWSVWLDGTDAELDDVESVTYFLHPTFIKPVRLVTDRASGFRLNSSGWGEFTIRAEILRRNGRVLKRSHHLKLTYPPDFESGSRSGTDISARRKMPPKDTRNKEAVETTAPAGHAPKVFLSSSAIDQPLAAAIGRAFKTLGIELVDAAALDPAIPMSASLSRVIGASDAAVALISEHRSEWTNMEIETATSLGVPVFPVILGKNTQLPDRVKDLTAFRLRSEADVETLVRQLTHRIES